MPRSVPAPRAVIVEGRVNPWRCRPTSSRALPQEMPHKPAESASHAANQLCRLVSKARELKGLSGASRPGVGVPVVDMMRRKGLEITLIPVTIRGGVPAWSSGRYYHVPKQDLIADVQLLLQMGILKLAGGMAEAEALKEEMGRMEVMISASGSEQFACWRGKEHDGLVVATTLACWWLTSGHG